MSHGFAIGRGDREWAETDPSKLRIVREKANPCCSGRHDHRIERQSSVVFLCMPVIMDGFFRPPSVSSESSVLSTEADSEGVVGGDIQGIFA
ncbi:MAG: hypothetical protein Q4A16_11475 [Lautropia sp.]|nr:hypothetical protein [Lautropia sp.]